MIKLSTYVTYIEKDGGKRTTVEKVFTGVTTSQGLVKLSTFVKAIEGKGHRVIDYGAEVRVNVEETCLP